MKNKIYMNFNKCDICSKIEEHSEKKLFSIWSDICDDCFLKNGSSTNNFELDVDKWVMKNKNFGDV